MFLNVCKQIFPIFHARISQKVKGVFNVKSSTHCFHMKTKILVDFQICISVPLREREKKIKNKSEQDQIKPNIQISQFKQFHGLSIFLVFQG